MSNPSKEKGTRFESSIVKILKDHTGLDWKRTPLSGAGAIKGDIHVINERNLFCIELKHYADDKINSLLLTGKRGSHQIFKWFEQAVLEAKKMKSEPLLIFKHDRSKPLVATYEEPQNVENYLLWSDIGVYIMRLDEWLNSQEIRWIK